ncbi:MAG: hypothetical protein RBU37_23820, partial [Myxococcota bacterium]|nr:hypothetical protein [Myxococcota bacterium]
HFKVFDEGNVEALFDRFLQQLVHRGYRPIKYRELSLEERWSEWQPCDLSNVDLSSLERAAASDMHVSEEDQTKPEYPPKAAPSPK